MKEKMSWHNKQDLEVEKDMTIQLEASQRSIGLGGDQESEGANTSIYTKPLPTLKKAPET